jgi:hypothetical protein
MSVLSEIEQLITLLSLEEKRQLIKRLKLEVGNHPLEKEWHTEAEVILNAISKSSDLTKRGIRGILAEASLGTYVIENLKGWKDVTPAGDQPFDYAIQDGAGVVRIQVKNQRLEKGVPKLGGKKYGKAMFIVETQKTRGGQAPDGKKTRPYRFGEFDILAVCLHPSTGDWSKFLYTVADWLLPWKDNDELIQTYQPVPYQANEAWTDSLETAIVWFRSGEKKRIWLDTPLPLFS